ncbi:hypothetical protein Spith_1233 [Spirochaeta thermophila DSM 6578]|uniref:Lipoprotein n=2 Tax=Winmispira thermophila TaxID=154 RepID=G0GEU3_WINT7|nr:hypothetical protein Spith_1233 [Spirochaeta thermophila DSM 6578]
MLTKPEITTYTLSEMKSRDWGVLVFSVVLLLAGCVSGQDAPVSPSPTSTPPVVVEEEVVSESEGTIEVSQEVYERTFVEIEAFLEELTLIIQKRDFEAWRSYLSQEYIARVSDPSYLARVSEEPKLKKRGVVLRTLEDYFQQVVVPSRSRVRLDKIEFVTKDIVKAYMVINETPYLLYRLRREEGGWKIY